MGIRKDGAIVVSRNIPTRYPEPSAHAESRLARKLDRGAIVYVVRITASGKLTLARPCGSCIRILKSKGVKKVFYSINEKEYGCVILQKT